MTLQQLSDILKGFYALQGEAQSITRDDLAKFLVEKGIVNDAEFPYIELDEFNKKVDEFAKTNFVLTALFSNPKSKIKTWEQLPDHLIKDLFNKLGCKPAMYKY